MSALSFRPAMPEDLQTIVALLADDPLGKTREDCTSPLDPGYTAAWLDPGYTAAWAAIDADPNQLLIVADIENAVVGCLQLSFIPGLSHKGALRGQIESVRVARTCRNLKIGRRMLGWAIEECRRRRCRMVQLTTNKIVRPLIVLCLTRI